MFQPEFKLTIGITSELNCILSGFLGYLSGNKTVAEKQPKSIESSEKEKEATGKQTRKPKADKNPVATENTETSPQESPAESPAVTLEMLRAKVKEVITADRSKRDAVEAKFVEFNASNPTTLDIKYYQEYWDFLNTL